MLWHCRCFVMAAIVAVHIHRWLDRRSAQVILCHIVGRAQGFGGFWVPVFESQLRALQGLRLWVECRKNRAASVLFQYQASIYGWSHKTKFGGQGRDHN